MARPRNKPVISNPTIETARVAELAFRAAMLAGVILCAVCVGWLITIQKEFAQSADRFGYLQMAADMRKGAAPHGLPRFTFDSPHAREMLGWMQAQGLASDNAVAVAPNAYHYDAGVDRIICQYPPGTGMMLRLLPEGSAVATWRMAAMVVLGGVGIGVACLPRARMLPIALMTLAVMAGLTIIPVAVSYSVDFLLIPLVVVVVAGLESRRRGRGGWIVLAVAGACLGWSSVVRLAAAFFLPGLMAAAVWLVEPEAGQGRVRVGKRLLRLGVVAVAFAVGVAPLLVHQHALTGRWLASTYTPVDATAPSLAHVWPNMVYYFAGEGDFLLIYLEAGAVVAGVWLAVCGRSIGWRRLTPQLAVVGLWFAGPTGYFLMHRVVTPYYQYLTIFVTLLGMAWVALRNPGPVIAGGKRVAEQVAAWAAVVYVLYQLVALPWPTPAMEAAFGMPQTTPPAGVEDPRAWVLADRLSGTLWHYNGIGAVRADTLDADVRWRFCEWLKERGEPVYFVEDNPEMAEFRRQLMEKGVRLRLAGNYARLRSEQKVAFCDVYRVEW